MRLDKFLKENGICSRSEAKKILKEGLVLVNGTVVKSADYKVDENVDQVSYDGNLIKYEKFVYIMLNKPAGYLSATEDCNQKTVLDLIPEYKHKNLFPFGRLDKDSVGLLILSNDGALAHELLSPKKHVDKKYYLKIQGKLTNEDVEKFKNGIVLEDGYECKSAALEIVTGDEISECYATISEGKFHQLKRMFKALGKEVVYLKRVSFGNVVLDDSLKEGEWRFLTETELDLLNHRDK